MDESAPAEKGERLSRAQRQWLLKYRDGRQNGVNYRVNTVYTRRNGSTMPGLGACRKAGLITSCEDPSLHPGGWRHDLTPAGREALTHAQV